MSFIPRLYLPDLRPSQEEIILDESATRYLVKVLRLEAGSGFSAFDAQQNQYQLTLKKGELPKATATILNHQAPEAGRSELFLALGQSLPKAAKMDLILRQGTEAGAHRFIPLVTQRSISRPEDAQYGHKNDRWKKILVEACRQCKRNDLPELDFVTDWDKVLGIFKDFDQVLMPYEKEAPTLRTVLESRPTSKKILVLVGPEGGWTHEEVIQAQENGAKPVHLPTPILRTETAGIAVLSMIQFFYRWT